MNGVPSSLSSKIQRLDSVDLLRGIVMVIMALDHVRDYFTDVRFYPLDLSQTNAALYMTRWITHLCAPTFVFLAGTGVFLSMSRGKTKSEISRFLLLRGIWLVILELTLVRFGWVFNLDYSLVILQVIWATGWSMVFLAGIIHFSTRTVTVVGIAIIVLHNTLDGIRPDQLGVFGWPWQILHVSGPIEFLPGYIADAAYPLIPWVGVMAAGYGFGQVLLMGETRRKNTLLALGVTLTLMFILIRATNLYGNPYPWTPQKNLLFTVFSFIDCEKYPPSLLYLLMTLGPAIASLAILEKLKGAFANFLTVFGRVPMFFYLLHIPFIHALAVVAYYFAGFDQKYMFSNIGPWDWPAGSGFGLPVVYLAWAFVILALYPLCHWYARLKQRRKDWWLSYL